MNEKFKSNCLPLTDYEREVLDILIEECAEVIQRATKMLRFGRDEVQAGQDLTNAERLALEIGDARHMMKVANEAGLAPGFRIAEGESIKERKLLKYMQTVKP